MRHQHEESNPCPGAEQDAGTYDVHVFEQMVGEHHRSSRIARATRLSARIGKIFVIGPSGSVQSAGIKIVPMMTYATERPRAAQSERRAVGRQAIPSPMRMSAIAPETIRSGPCRAAPLSAMSSMPVSHPGPSAMTPVAIQYSASTPNTKDFRRYSVARHLPWTDAGCEAIASCSDCGGM